MSTATDPADLSAVEARRLIARRRLSPVELAEACIARVEEVNPAVNAMVACDFDGLRKEAREAEAEVMAGGVLGALQGLPVAVKDMIDVTGLPTTFGSTIYAENIARRDDPQVAALRAAGAGILGKANNPEFSAGANSRNAVYGVTGNPHDPTKSAAGSSGGSAVALACGMAPLATGSDLGGSLRNPAAFCGVVGFRPSPGIVPGEARGLAAMALSTSGPMARTVADAALMLSVMARPDARDPYTLVMDGMTPWDPEAFAVLPRVDLPSKRFAVTEDFGFAVTEGIVRRAFREKIAGLTPLLGRIEEAHPDCHDADRIFSVLRAVTIMSSQMGHYRNKRDQLGPNVIENVEEGLGYSAWDVTEAMVAQGTYQRRWLRFFEDHDYILCPAITISPRDWHELYPTEIDGTRMQSYYHWLSMAYASTLPGHPSISVPLGRDETGMPFGLQIIGKRHDDLGVLAVAAEIEAAVAGDPALSRPLPDLAALRAAPPIANSEGFLGFA